ncbi:efflux RND transporter periplasmic adaptor subunit [Desulfocurvus sp.]|uniref:efflux RND transporter periplasmic adaptor subunit n=1 Tax=Desulfocurvus sp. TaxID=2871698 RepID=UPI0025C3FA8D|nr:efflux RND transporter periplasmic adaptor subunit [Desulfocurvus sp.]MCK9241009.1 efflux RND transporter periplasmic adaptor subunit [Desulfocurvus sp.]
MKGIATGLVLVFLFTLASGARAEDGAPQGPPPTLVILGQAEDGTATPRADFVGSVEFPEVSLVAAEVGGRVLAVNFEEGGRVRAGQALVTLDTALLDKGLAAAQAGLAGAEASLELARLELARRTELMNSRSIAEQDFDEARFTVRELEAKAEAQRAQAERLGLELDKARVPAPFAGVILQRAVERGQWLAAGAGVALLGRDDAVDVVVSVPQDILPFIAAGQPVEVTVSGRRLEGAVHAVIPKGDVATRTFPVKIRVAGAVGLAEGMQAVAHLPSGQAVQAVRVPRDAVGLMRGQNVVFVAEAGAARLVPVRVVAYEGLHAWVEGPGLAAGLPVVVKGKERLYPGAPLRTEGAD